MNFELYEFFYFTKNVHLKALLYSLLLQNIFDVAGMSVQEESLPNTSLLGGCYHQTSTHVKESEFDKKEKQQQIATWNWVEQESSTQKKNLNWRKTEL